MRFVLPFAIALAAFAAPHAQAETILVEAESFHDHGGWSLDTQFIQTMGSPYLLAHGLGQPVKDATTTIHVPAAGKYQVFVRTKDWVARWKAPGQPGRFQLLVNGEPLKETFGTSGAEWNWQAGGVVELLAGEVQLALHDMTGFDGRCDAILLTTDQPYVLPEDGRPLAAWRKELLGLPAQPAETEKFDLVVVGGGYAGMGAAISAARMGCKVALIQDRPVLGGNGSSEVRVWSQGLIRRGRYPRIGEIVQEFADTAANSPGTYEEFGDAKKEAVVRAEPNIKLFLNHHAHQVEKQGDRITAVHAFDTKTSEERRFVGKFFVDCTGHGTIGALADADFEMLMEGHLGMSNMWRWVEADQKQTFPETSWALQLEMQDFPYPHRGKGEWFWESGFDKHPIEDLESMRDWNLRAVYGAFNAMKNGDGAAKHPNAQLVWVAFVGGPRESRLLRGEVVLSRDDIASKRDFPDGCVPSTWSIDLHYPKKQYMKKYPEDPFISRAEFDAAVDRNYGYPIPYRCFYSRNIPNLFMAGRNISVTHQALGTTRVMKTCGMMGEVVGKAASICCLRVCDPGDVYATYLDELKELLKLPGRARRETLGGPIDVSGEALPLPVKGISAEKLSGIVIDNPQAKRHGNWTDGGVAGFVGDEYLYASGGANAEIRYEFQVPTSGVYQVRVSYTPHANRSANVPVVIESASGKKEVQVNQQQPPTIDKVFVLLGEFEFQAGQPAAVVISPRKASGTVVADAVQLVPVK